MGHKGYFFLVLFGVAACVLGVFIIGLYLQPLSGDLTRLGWESEHDFRRNMPQMTFESEHAKTAKPGEYTGYHDVVVIGDSFSAGRAPYQWQEFFVDLTGWSVITFFWGKVKLEDVLASPVFREQPPRLVILETVERGLSTENRFSRLSGGCDSPSRGSAPSGWKFVEAKRPMTPVDSVPDYSFGAVNPEYVRQYIFRALKNFFLGPKKKPTTYRLALTTNSLFSNRRSDELLVYRDDVAKRDWSEEDYEKMRCTARSLQKRIETNGKTVAVFMVVPDKLTAYADYLVDSKLRRISRLNYFAVDGVIRFPRIDLAIKQAVDSGGVDVYLPNDTHWGYLGHQIAANALVDYLQRLGVSSPRYT